MSVPYYRYTHNQNTGTLLIGNDDEAYLFQTDSGTAYPLSLDDLIDLDNPEADFLAQADALVGAWRDLCQSAADLPGPDIARQTLRDCLDVMRQAIETGGDTDPAPAVAWVPAA